MTDDVKDGEAGAQPVCAQAFDKVIQVSQVPSAGGVLGMFIFAGIMPLGPIWLFAPFFEGGAEAGLLMGLVHFACVILWGLLGVASMFFGFFVWYVIETRWQAWRKTTPFDAKTRVRIDSLGLHIDGMGSVTWREVLDLEGIPDSSSAIIVHTTGLKSVMLREELDVILPVLQHHMAAHAELSSALPVEHTADAELGFKALVFSWNRFNLWMWSGHAMAGVVAVTILYDGRKGVVVDFLVALLLYAMVAGLIRAIPIFQLDTMGSRRVRSFALRGCELTVLGETDVVDLKGARITRRNRSGLGYQMDFFSIRPRRGRKLDLMADKQVMARLMATWRRLPVEFIDERQVLWEHDVAP